MQCVWVSFVAAGVNQHTEGGGRPNISGRRWGGRRPPWADVGVGAAARFGELCRVVEPTFFVNLQLDHRPQCQHTSSQQT